MGKKSWLIANIIAIVALVFIAYSILKNDGDIEAMKSDIASIPDAVKAAVPSSKTAKPQTSAVSIKSAKAVAPVKTIESTQPIKAAVPPESVKTTGLETAVSTVPAVQPVNTTTETQPIKPAKTETSQSITETSQSIRVLLVPEKETTISSTTAARINRLNGTLGKSFKSGQVLVAFDCKQEFARISMSKAELASKIDQHEAKVRMQGLEQASDVEVSMAASEANRARAQLSLHHAQARACKILAPWNGRIAKVYAKNYMTVSPGEPLMDLVKSGPLKLKLNIPSTALASVKKGSAFTVTIDETSKTYDAKVTAINSRVDSVTQTVEIEASLLADHAELLSGMSGISDLASFN